MAPWLYAAANTLAGLPRTGVSRMPVDWLDTSTRAHRSVLADAESGVSWGPRIGGVQPRVAVSLPAIELHEFANATVCATSSAVLLDDRLVIERVPGIDPARGNYAGGFVVGHGRDSALVKRLPAETLDAGVFLGGNGSFNYYHWLIELLPKLNHLDQRSPPLLISEDAVRIPSFADALARVAGRMPTIALRKDRAYRVRRLLHMNTPVVCPFNLFPGYTFTPSDFLTRQDAVDFVRGRLANATPSGPATRGRRIFLARDTRRRGYNQAEVAEVFSAFGFESVVLERMSLAEQARTVSEASFIAGPTGAAWSNMIFALPGTVALCWMADILQGFAAYSNLAASVGVSLHYLLHPSPARSTSEVYQLDYRLDPAQLRNALEQLI